MNSACCKLQLSNAERFLRKQALSIASVDKQSSDSGVAIIINLEISKRVFVEALHGYKWLRWIWSNHFASSLSIFHWILNHSSNIWAVFNWFNLFYKLPSHHNNFRPVRLKQVETSFPFSGLSRYLQLPGHSFVAGCRSASDTALPNAATSGYCKLENGAAPTGGAAVVFLPGAPAPGETRTTYSSNGQVKPVHFHLNYKGQVSLSTNFRIWR